MKIVHVGRFSNQKVDGIAQGIYALALAQLEAGHQVFFYGIGNRDDATVDPAGIELREFRRDRNPFRAPAGLERVIQTAVDAIDLFHLHSVFIPANYAISRVLGRCGCPYVITPNGGYNKNVFAQNRLKKWLYYALFERRCVLNATGIVCVTDPEVQDVRRLGYAGPITVIPNAVVTQGYGELRRNPANQLMYMGRNELRQKGLDRMLQLFAAVERQDGTISLEIFSGDDQRDSVQAFAQSLHLNRVHFNQPVFGAEKLRCLERTALYLHTSRWEVFGIAIAEAMMSGAPVAISNECYLAPLVTSLGCGLVLDTYDEAAAASLIQLVHDRDQNTAMGLRGRRYAFEHFSAQTVAQETVTFYTSLR